MLSKIARFLAVPLIVILALATWTWNSETGQDWLLEKAVGTALRQPVPMAQFDGLKVFLCGTASPLPAPGRAQACVAVLAGDSLYLVDAGAGSAQTLALGRVPLNRLKAVLLTHFHSDHIAALPEINLNSWVTGRPRPLSVIGPTGVAEIVDGFNSTYELDRRYRVAHHGEDLLPSRLGILEAREIETESVFELGDLKVTSFLVNHHPIHPAIGYRFDYRGRSVVISGDATVTPRLIKASTGADLLLQDALSLPIIKALEKAAAGTRMEHIFFDIQDYHAHTSELPELVDQSGVRQLALYHLVPPPQNALFEKIFMRGLPQGTILTEDSMMFELPAGSDEIRRIDP